MCVCVYVYTSMFMGAVVVIATEHYKTMIKQHLDDPSTYKKLDLNIDMKIYKNLRIIALRNLNKNIYMKNF